MPDDINWILTAAAALLAGCALGAVFFGGLWWTVQRGAASPTPARWFICSWVLRTTVVLVGFYAVAAGPMGAGPVAAGQPVWLGLCLLGFILARAAVLRMSRKSPATGLPVTRQTTGKPPCA